MILSLSAQNGLRRFTVCHLLLMTAALGATALFADMRSVQKPRSSPQPPTTATASRALPSSPQRAERRDGGKAQIVRLSGAWSRAYDLPAGRVVEISVHLERPSALPPNARIAVEWTRARGDASMVQGGNAGREPAPSSAPAGREPDAFGIYTLPTADWRKTLHALDGDVYLLYRAPVSGRYTLRLKPVTEEEPVGNSPRWREPGHAPQLVPLPRRAPWPAGTVVPVAVSVRPVALGGVEEQERLRTVLECEPNDTPEQAQSLALTPGEGVRTWEITGGADDIEFFDNGRVGQSGDDWFRLDYTGKEPRLLTAQLSLPGQVLAARIRVYRLEVGGEGRKSSGGGASKIQNRKPKVPRSCPSPSTSAGSTRAARCSTRTAWSRSRRAVTPTSGRTSRTKTIAPTSAASCSRERPTSCASRPTRLATNSNSACSVRRLTTTRAWPCGRPSTPTSGRWMLG